MPAIGIEVLTDKQNASERVNKCRSGSATKKEKVTNEGNYYRELEVPLTLYELFLEKAEDDPEVDVKSVQL